MTETRNDAAVTDGVTEAVGLPEAVEPIETDETDETVGTDCTLPTPEDLPEAPDETSSADTAEEDPVLPGTSREASAEVEDRNERKEEDDERERLARSARAGDPDGDGAARAGDPVVDPADPAPSEGTFPAQIARSEVTGEGREEVTVPRDFTAEVAELGELYPFVRLSEIPAEVWTSPLPLSAAYALYERKSEQVRQAAERANRRNADRSTGALSLGCEPYFTPEEVRAMSQKEVRENYDAILRSMKRWH